MLFLILHEYRLQRSSHVRQARASQTSGRLIICVVIGRLGSRVLLPRAAPDLGMESRIPVLTLCLSPVCFAPRAAPDLGVKTRISYTSFASLSHRVVIGSHPVVPRPPPPSRARFGSGARASIGCLRCRACPSARRRGPCSPNSPPPAGGAAHPPPRACTG
jgi:hypothetical protein